jgi:UDP-N-acetylbacillosamine N-acetyltransferase
MRLVIIGAGGYGRVVFELAEQIGKYSEICFLDDNSADRRVVGKCNECADFINSDTEFYVAFGANELRLKLINDLIDKGANIATIIHKSAYISPSAKIDFGTAILPNAVINTNCIINKGVIVNCGAVIDHDCVIGEGSHICLNTVIKADNHIPSCTKVDAGVVIENRQYPIK